MRYFFFILTALVLLLLSSLIPKEWINVSDELKLVLFTAFSSFVIAIYQNDKNKERDVEARLFKEKAEIYENIFNLIKEQFRNTRTGKKGNETKLVSKFEDINYKLLVWGSIETIDSWTAILETDISENDDPYAKLLPWANLYKSLRKDLGHHDGNIKPMKLMSLQLDQDGRNDMRKKNLI